MNNYFEIINFTENFFSSIFNMSNSILNYLTTEIHVFDFSFTVYESLFGGFIITVIGYAVVKFILDIWPG